MITAVDLTKKFDSFTALDRFDSNIPDGCIYGLVGSNGSGKSTLLRLIAGIYRPDEGEILVDGARPAENTRVRERTLLVADELYFIPQSTMDDMAGFYAGFYPGFDRKCYEEIRNWFPIDPKKRIQTFSKGMKRQVSLILALSCMPDILLLDEAFDGLDPVIRGAVRRILADRVADTDMTVIIASHNLRELEDICDVLGLLHQGKVVFERDIDAVKLGLCKVQAGFSHPAEVREFDKLDIMQASASGSVLNMVVRGNSEEVLRELQAHHPLFAETVPLTLEEVFIYEMEAVGYDHNKIIF